MSSMRNAVQRRNHRERAQPLERQKWGILEKHKDYSLRAADHNAKRSRLKILREKAADRNPDEFSFGMLSAGMNKRSGTKVGDRGNEALSNDVVKLLKTQDVGYVRTALGKVRRERERVEEGFVLEDEGGVEALSGEAKKGRGRHTVFVGDREGQEGFKPEEWFGVEDEGHLERAWNRQRRRSGDAHTVDAEEDAAVAPKKSARKSSEDKDAQAAREERALRKRREKDQESRRLKLEALKSRERDLTIAQEELEAQRARMNNSTGGVNKNGVKFKVRERKR